MALCNRKVRLFTRIKRINKKTSNVLKIFLLYAHKPQMNFIFIVLFIFLIHLALFVSFVAFGQQCICISFCEKLKEFPQTKSGNFLWLAVLCVWLQGFSLMALRRNNCVFVHCWNWWLAKIHCIHKTNEMCEKWFHSYANRIHVNSNHRANLAYYQYAIIIIPLMFPGRRRKKSCWTLHVERGKKLIRAFRCFIYGLMVYSFRFD